MTFQHKARILGTPKLEDGRSLTQRLVRYSKPSGGRGALELVITGGPFVACWACAWASLHFAGLWMAWPFMIAAAGFLVRLFMIQHDCGHGAFFQNRPLNDWAGRIIGVFTMTPYDFWRRTHAIHHATSGNLDARGIGDVDTLTVGEYLARSRWGKLRYRLYRNPLIMFGVGPAYLFLLQHRLPVGFMRAGWGPWLSTFSTNLGIAALAGATIWAVGLASFLLIHLPIMILAASAGVWLFYVQHQFEETQWARRGAWDFHEAALHGSSHYDLPAVLRWFTANIGVHHVHHLCSRVPFYRLRAVLREHPELNDVGRLTLRDSLKCVPLVLWDEGRCCLVSFRDVRLAVRLDPEGERRTRFDRFAQDSAEV